MDINKWKKHEITNSQTEDFAALHSVFREICLQSLTTNLTTPGLIDIFTYYPSIFDYHSLSDSCKTVNLNIGQVSWFQYDDDNNKDELCKGNMFLALHADVFSSMRNKTSYTVQISLTNGSSY
ncbi:unnamed protein product [Ambrosiozyma monospora]|uniref:Unnamed protein product n=1 Tax=Ambrosiozyma monospora TaxID=43982 RepID=A0ACB5TTD7_AMBMO|nr:unnamed protein product [Ambrosiozyma monospora]